MNESKTTPAHARETMWAVYLNGKLLGRVKALGEPDAQNRARERYGLTPELIVEPIKGKLT